MENLNFISITLEIAVVILAAAAAIRLKRPCGWFWAFTFLIYVFYDLARTLSWNLPSAVMAGGFLLASASAVTAAALMNKK